MRLMRSIAVLAALVLPAGCADGPVHLNGPCAPNLVSASVAF